MKVILAVLLAALPCFGQVKSCLPSPAGLVGWWRAENNANDSAGTNNGAVINSVYFEPGLVGECFHFVSGPNPRVRIPDNPSLVLTNSLTIEGWIKANLGWWLLNRADDSTGHVPYGLGFDGYLHPRFILCANAIDHVVLDAPQSIPTGVWLHIAATLDGDLGDMRIYVNGQMVAQTYTTIRPMGALDGAYPGLGIGNSAGTAGFPFDGWIDEISLYSRALTPTEIQAIYAAGSAGKCSGPSAPVILSQPQGQVGYWGANATFSVSASGNPPPDYLWYKDGFPINWATNSTLILTNLSLSDGGEYSVLVSNVAGSLTSSDALLIVNPAGIGLGLYPGLTIDGVVGKTFGIQYTTNVNLSPAWTTLSTVTLTQPFQVWFDTNNDLTLGANPRRFYRVVAVPSESSR